MNYQAKILVFIALKRNPLTAFCLYFLRNTETDVICRYRENRMRYRERLRSLREERDLTQDRVAEILGISQRTYSDYESGRLRIPVDRLMALAKFYDCSIDYISGASDIHRPYPGR